MVYHIIQNLTIKVKTSKKDKTIGVFTWYMKPLYRSNIDE